MQHLQIFFLILNLIIGTGIILYIYQVYKKLKKRYILNLMYYSISFNILVFVDLNYKYLMSNIFDNNFSEIPLLIILFLITLIFLAEYGITYYLNLVVIGLNNRKISNKIRYLFIAWVSFFASASILGILIYYVYDNESWFYVIHEVWILSMIFIILSTLINHLIINKKISKAKQRKSLQYFGYLFLVGYIGYTLSQLDFYFFHIKIESFDSIILLMINLCPFLWLRFFHIKYQKIITSNTNSIISLNKFTKEYNLTAREQEVVELIMQGKTNNEIEKHLFISFNTVKNHIYNIFKKMDVNSRSQLIHFVSNFNNNTL